MLLSPDKKMLKKNPLKTIWWVLHKDPLIKSFRFLVGIGIDIMVQVQLHMKVSIGLENETLKARGCWNLQSLLN